MAIYIFEEENPIGYEKEAVLLNNRREIQKTDTNILITNKRKKCIGLVYMLRRRIAFIGVDET